MSATFLPANFDLDAAEKEAQASGGGAFLKLEEGDNMIRILPCTIPGLPDVAPGYQYRRQHPEDASKKQVVFLREEPGQEVYAEILPDNYKKRTVDMCWKMIVWDYRSASVKIFDCDKKTAISGIIDVMKSMQVIDPNAQPTDFDLNIVKPSKSGGSKRYEVKPAARGPIAPHIQEEVNQYMINPSAAYDSEKMFMLAAEYTPAVVATQSPAVAAMPAAPAAPVVTIADTLKTTLQADLASGNLDSARVTQLTQWAAGKIAEFNAVASDGNGAALISQIVDSVAAPAPAMPEPVSTPVVPAAPAVPELVPASAPAAPAAGAAAGEHDDIPF